VTIRKKKTRVTLFTIEMHATGLRTSAKNKTASSVNDAMRGTVVTMAPTMTNPIDTVLLLEDALKGSLAFLSQLQDGTLAPEL
jgi:hypothetical protein